MLLAKVLDKLFNRRNTFEIESLEGDIVYDGVSLKEVVDWVSQMKELTAYDEENDILTIQPMIKMGGGIDITSITDIAYFDEDENDYIPYFPSLEDQAGKSVVVNEDETGFEYQETGISLKVGNFIYNGDTDKLEWVEEIPDDYTGLVYYFADDVFEVYDYVNGSERDSISISPISGVNKVNLPALTHSFNELDATLKQIVEDAINDGWTNGVACTEAQWNAIKSLLDKSLYLNYDGNSLIKVYTDGISEYKFGALGAQIAPSIEINYDTNTSLLYMIFYEI